VWLQDHGKMGSFFWIVGGVGIFVLLLLIDFLKGKMKKRPQ